MIIVLRRKRSYVNVISNIHDEVMWNVQGTFIEDYNDYIVLAKKKAAFRPLQWDTDWDIQGYTDNTSSNKSR